MVSGVGFARKGICQDNLCPFTFYGVRSGICQERDLSGQPLAPLHFMVSGVGFVRKGVCQDNLSPLYILWCQEWDLSGKGFVRTTSRPFTFYSVRSGIYQERDLSGQPLPLYIL
ncbi:hypothetical protein PoB_005597800 [Plakobranchus ocellatus]|uniref:Uncharacterized protein n=1 Tax=Plakobranchus ocellatus TaxID=259542 RepID=A0AAV4CET6_9GAST|nr:hypothetical protein PoB_005597800 [Plakobranchus ocellatus]